MKVLIEVDDSYSMQYPEIVDDLRQLGFKVNESSSQTSRISGEVESVSQIQKALESISAVKSIKKESE